MNSQELLGLLTARVQRFHMAPGGIPRLTCNDVSHALGMIQNHDVTIYGRVKYCGQHEYAQDCAKAIRRHALIYRGDKRWRNPRENFMLDMAYVIMTEAVDPHTCTWCDGRGEVRPEHGPVIICDGCQGTGKRHIRGIDRARLLGMLESSWSDTWAERYREIQIATVDKWEDILAGALKKRLVAAM